MGTPPTAILTGNDLQALGVYQAARELATHLIIRDSTAPPRR